LLKPDGTFRETEKLAAAMQAVGLKQDRPSVAYCNTGHVAAITWFVQHELLGYQNASLYDGSMLAWTTHGNDAVLAISP
jgi:thiosulfate/3-mercaptopyruvate sulfurtransferase